MSTISIVGLGVVGEPLAKAFEREGHEVYGYDISKDRIAALVEQQSEGGFPEGVNLTTGPNHISDCDFVIITVPTPVDKSNQPNLEIVAEAASTVGNYLSRDTIVILESTVYPGATREVVIPALEESSGFSSGDEFTVGYSPERVNPGAEHNTVESTVKVVSAQDDRALGRVQSLYESIVRAGVHVAPTIETAEAAKCLENIQRDVNIGLVNEFAMACDTLDIEIDPNAVLEAAGTKWNFQKYSPGIVGGHCIPVDPYFMISRLERAGYSPNLMKQARSVNEEYPSHTASKIAEQIIEVHSNAGKIHTTKSSGTEESSSHVPTVLLLGMAYKSNTVDIRNRGLRRFIKTLQQHHIDVFGYDPHIDDEVISSYFGIDVPDELDLASYDGVVINTYSTEFNHLGLEKHYNRPSSPKIFDLSGSLNLDTFEKPDWVRH